MRKDHKNAETKQHIIAGILILLFTFASIESTYGLMNTISGAGSGELLLNFTIHSTTPVISGSYSYDIENIHIPPISSTIYVSSPPITEKLSGYAYDMEGIYMPSIVAKRAGPVEILSWLWQKSRY